MFPQEIAALFPERLPPGGFLFMAYSMHQELSGIRLSRTSSRTARTGWSIVKRLLPVTDYEEVFIAARPEIEIPGITRATIKKSTTRTRR